MHRPEWRRLCSIFLAVLFALSAVPHAFALENSPYLAELNVDGGKLNEAFSPKKHSYTITADDEATAVTITAVAEDPAAVATINGTAATQHTLTLEGTSKASIKVTAADGERNATYTVELIAPAAPSEKASAASPEETPAVLPTETPVAPPAETPVVPPVELPVVPPVETPVAPPEKNPVAPSEEAPALPEENLAAASNNAYLFDLDGEFDLLTPYLDRTVFHYTVQPYLGETSVYLVFEAEDSAATIRVNGEQRNDVTLKLSNGVKEATVEITAADGVTKNIYTFAISRTSNNAELFYIDPYPETGRFDPEFHPDITAYDAIPTGEYPYVFFDFLPMDAYSTVKVNGEQPPQWEDGWYYWAVGTEAGLSTTAKIEIFASDGTAKKTYTVRYSNPSIKPGTPSLTAAAQRFDSVKLSWNEISGARGYEVYRATSSGGTYTKVATVDSATTYTDTGLKSGQRYYYKVRAYSLSYSGKIYGSFSSYKYATPAWGTLKATASVTHKTVRLSWNAVADATGYEVLRSTSSKGTYVSIAANVVETTLTDTGVTAGKTYYYKVRPLHNSGTTTQYGPDSAVLSATPVWGSVKFSAPSVTHKTVTLRWNTVAGATGYEVLRSTSSKGTYVSIAADVEETTFTDTGVVAGKTYYYKVRPLDASGETTLYGTMSAYQSATPSWPGVKFTSSASVTHKAITLRWNAVAGATGYEVLRSTSSKGTYVSIAANVDDTTYTDTGVAAGKTYYYKVRPIDASGETTLYGTMSTYQSATPVWAAVKFGTAAPTYRSIGLRWNTIAGATGYEVQRSTSSKGTYTVIATVTEASFTDTDVVTGKTYYYKVRPLDASGEPTLYGPASAYQSVTAAWPQVSVKAVSSTYNSVLITWNAVAGATAYEVQRSTSSKGVYMAIAEGVTETGFTDTGLTTGKTYYYKVRPYNGSADPKVYGAASPYKSATPSWPSLTLQAASGGFDHVKLSWNAVAGAAGFEVYRADSSRGTYRLVATATASSLTDEGLSAGKTYYYKVRAFDETDGSRIYGGYSAYKYAKPVPTAPTGLTAASSQGGIALDWNDVPSAAMYEVYRATSKSGSYTKIATTADSQTLSTGLSAGRTYYYKVRAYTLSGKDKIYSSYSAIVSGKK